MLTIYPACFIKDKTSDDYYDVVFPDWDNAVTAGYGFPNAMEMAIDCLAGLMFSAKIDKRDIPSPSKIEDIDLSKVAKFAECDREDIETHLVTVDAEVYAKEHFYKCVKKTITIFDWQDKEGTKRNINFSKICRDALTAALIK